MSSCSNLHVELCFCDPSMVWKVVLSLVLRFPITLVTWYKLLRLQWRSGYGTLAWATSGVWEKHFLSYTAKIIICLYTCTSSFLLGINQHSTPTRPPTAIPRTNSIGPLNILNIKLPKECKKTLASGSQSSKCCRTILHDNLKNKNIRANSAEEHFFPYSNTTSY